MKNVKKLILSLCCLSILSFNLIGCKEVKDPKNEETPAQEEVAEVDPPKQIITNEEAKNLYDDYDRNVVPLLEGIEGAAKPAARFVEYDLDSIKQYIAYVEQEAALADSTEVKTLRFYFGKYKKSKKSGKNTVFIVPTTQFEGINYNQGFYIEVAADGTKTAMPISGSGKEKGMGSAGDTTTKKAYASMLPTPSKNPTYFAKQSLTMNRGTEGPPPNSDYQ
ncbi:hypothetical protein GGR42_003064 [Saonia flava]|uniref:Lipoprotein n=1 Tax=Saonia flava TaxID=523696 RepID=A0A846R2C2_9FLAO|nr:hypothetical protein [Saonia flava]NJB72573.1 hypothetical protein [Saonia flava]